jgi:hypothetical protein
MFPRRNYTNDTANVDNFIKLLSTDWVAPEQAFEHSNMFPDPHSEFLRAKAWHDQQESEQVDAVISNDDTGVQPDDAVGAARQRDAQPTATGE